MIRHNEHPKTLKPTTDVYQGSAKFIDRRVTPDMFNPCVYSLEKDNQNVFMAGGSKGTLDFIFYDNKRPYKEMQTVSVATGGFQCGMLAEDKRTEGTKQDNFLLFALFSCIVFTCKY